MRVAVDYDACAATGSCAQICPEVFEMDVNGALQVLEPEPDESMRSLVEEAAEFCPTRAIAVTG